MSNSNKNEDALMELLSPDGYYTYLGVSKAVATATILADDKSSPSDPPPIDEDAIKKNYRKLSLKHHPDKPGGDADTFRILNRAQKVLMNPKLRKQYDILGIDLDDDEEDNQDHHDEKQSETSSSQGIIQEIAGTILTGIIQVGVRTLMMGAVSVVLVRYRWTLYPALAFLAFVMFQIFQQRTSLMNILPPFWIAAGLMIMSNAVGTTDDEFVWSKQYWLGESLVIFMFTYNSVPIQLVHNVVFLGALATISILFALWFRGKFWNYAIVVILIGVVAIFTAVAFPMMELLLEAILNEKLKKVGDKVRQHHQILHKYYEKKVDH